MPDHVVCTGRKIWALHTHVLSLLTPLPDALRRYEMITLQKPFRGEFKTLYANIQKCEFCMPNVSKPGERVLTGLLTYDPKERIKLGKQALKDWL